MSIENLSPSFFITMACDLVNIVIAPNFGMFYSHEPCPDFNCNETSFYNTYRGEKGFLGKLFFGEVS